jgi:hypothetical protein
MRGISSVFFFFLLTQACQKVENNQTDFISESKLQAHPRLLLRKNEEEELKKMIGTDNTWGMIHKIIIGECDELLNKPVVEYKLDGVRLLEQSRACRKRVMYLSYAWRLTHNKKYLDRVEQELLAVSSFKDWNPSHFLDVAEMTMAAAIGYDWLYNDLSKPTLEKIKEAILTKGIEPSLKSENNWWLKENTNWNQVCNAGMTYGAIAIFEHQPELSKKIIERSIEFIRLPMKEYDPDGSYQEGYEYWRYGTTYNVYLIDALEKNFNSSFGLMENSGFSKAANYPLHMVGPTGLNFNYSDGTSQSWLNPAMFWFANRQKDYSLLYSEKVLLKDVERISGVRDLPSVIIWGAGVDLKSISNPKELIWQGKGKNPIVLMRSGWNADAIYLGLKGGTPSAPHGHMDIGSFVMDAMGERWAMDFGMQDYGLLESKGLHIWHTDQNSDRWKVFRYNNLGHNTLSFNNEWQRSDGHAPVIQSTDDKNFLSGVVDLSKIYPTIPKTQRGVAIVDGKYAVIRDEIELADSPVSIQWRLITPASVQIINSQTAKLKINSKTLLIKVIEPVVSLKTWSAQPPHDYDEPNPNASFLGFEFKGKSKSKIQFTILLVPEGVGESEFKVLPPISKWRNKN